MNDRTPQPTPERAPDDHADDAPPPPAAPQTLPEQHAQPHRSKCSHAPIVCRARAERNKFVGPLLTEKAGLRLPIAMLTV